MTIKVTATHFDADDRPHTATFEVAERPKHCPSCAQRGVAIPRNCPHTAQETAPMPPPTRQTPKQFATYLSETLGPDLKESGHEFTAGDVMKAGQMISSLLPDAANARAARALLRSKMDAEGEFDLSNDDEHETLLKLAEILGVK